MKVLLDIQDSKAALFTAFLRSLTYVKTKNLTEPKAQLMEEMKEAVEEMKLIKAGKKKARNADDFINEL